MKHKELVALKSEELEKKKQEANLELLKLRGQVATGTPPKNPGQIRQLRKMLARINFIQSKEENKKDA